MDTNKNKFSVSIIIVNYNVTNEVRNCILSIKRVLENVIDLEIIVIDNNSPDRSIIGLTDEFPDVKVELLDKNYGYAKANNIGVQKSTKSFILLLNPDTIIIEDFVNPIVEYIHNNKAIGACGPQLIYSDNSYQNSTGYKMGILYEAAEAFMFINTYRQVYKNRIIKSKTDLIKVNWLSGACLLMDSNLFKSVKGFNEDYFLNYEDIDLCKKIEDSGFINYYFPNFKCIHLDQTSQKKNYERLVLSRYKSRLIYSRYHYGFFKKSIIRIIHLIGLFLRLILTPFLYKGLEKEQRKKGYKKAFKLMVVGHE